jgi:hypothetical protein
VLKSAVGDVDAGDQFNILAESFRNWHKGDRVCTVRGIPVDVQELVVDALDVLVHWLVILRDVLPMKNSGDHNGLALILAAGQ